LKKFSLVFILIIALIAAIFMFGCDDGAEAPVEEADDTEEAVEETESDDVFVIGAVLPMTGPAAVFGEKFDNAYSMAVDEINAAGGVNGIMLEILIEGQKNETIGGNIILSEYQK